MSIIKQRIINHPFKCLFIIFIVIYILTSLIVSFFIFNYRLKSISRLVLTTINQESDTFKYFINQINENKFVFKDIESNLLKLTSQNFSYIKVFDKNHKPLFYAKSITIKNKEFNKISRNFYKEFLKNGMKKKVDFFYFKKRLFLILIEKIGNKGFVEAIYQVPKDMNDRIKINLIQSIKIISFVLLITFFVIFLILSSFTRTIKNFNFQLLNENINFLQTIGVMIAKRDSETGEHNYRVTYYAVKIAENLKISINMKALIKGAFLHDIGKIAIPDNILLKPGKLTEKEFEIMKTHVAHGIEILKNNDFLIDAIDVVAYHHEKVDGTGYLKGLKGEQIPINARIFAVADVFDALTSKRPYKAPFSFEKSMQIIKDDTGKHFCPIVVEAFEKIAREMYNKISNSNSEELRILIKEIIVKYFK